MYMFILGIETSCDDTSVALVEDGQIVHAVEVLGQEEVHMRTGGVVPEVAAREHIKKIIPTVEATLERAGKSLSDISYVAVTERPGLLGSLLVGYTTGQTLAWLLGVPCIPVHHIEGHMAAPWLLPKEAYEAGVPLPEIVYPLVGLTVSGGHNDLVYMTSPTEFSIIGGTLDDAAGEAFDKVARMLELGFPGGPRISEIARQGTNRFDLPRPMREEGNLDFSFSGLKSAVRRLVDEEIKKEGILSPSFVADMACSFEICVVEVLVEKLRNAARHKGVDRLLLTGGVSANQRLREEVKRMAKEEAATIVMPYIPLYSTDNAAMIAARAYFDITAYGVSSAVC